MGRLRSMRRFAFYLTLLRYSYGDAMYMCNFRALVIILMNFVRLVSTIFNHEQMVWPSHVITTENENNRSVIGIFYKLLHGRNHVNLAELFLGY